MYWNVIDDNRKEILKKITDNISLNNYYMAGGTALALQTGIRESFDFDFFVQDDFDTNILVQELDKLGVLKVTFVSSNTLHCILDDIQLTFLYFTNNLIEEKIRVDGFNNLFLASIVDIATMKLIAISQRGTKKDFFDLYSICVNNGYSLKEVFDFLKGKYNEDKLNYFHILKSIIYFEDAEDEILSKTYVEYDWDRIKEFYIEEYSKIEFDK